MSILRRRALIEQGDIRPYWYDIEEDWDYIIDQTGKYKNPIIINKANRTYYDDAFPNAVDSIVDIRYNSFNVVGYYDETSAKLIYEVLARSNKTIIKHPTSAYPINININDYLTEHPTADVFMKLPEFWWKCWDVNDNPDTVAFKFTMIQPSDANNWHHWDGNTLIGVYKGHIDGNNNPLLRSVPQATITNNKTRNDFITAATNKGPGYKYVTYESHRIIALLFFGLYGTTNTDEFKTSGSYLSTTGRSADIGIDNDSNSSFWGLEDWINFHRECIYNLSTHSNSKFWLNIDNYEKTGIIREYLGSTSTKQGYASKMVLGSEADLIIKKDSVNSLPLFDGWHTAVVQSYKYATRGDASLTGLQIDKNADDASTTQTTRLQYEGNKEQNIIPNSPASLISSYVLDQTNPNGDPNNAIVFDNDNSVILAIKAASDFYACENKDWGSDTPEFIKMSKSHKLTTAGGVLLDANNYDIFMKLPEFWWKCENIDNNEDKVRFSFTMTNPNDNTWFHWEGDTFIGVYKAYTINNKTYSRSGVVPTKQSSNATTYDYTRTHAKNRGNGFDIISYEVHQIMCILAWGYLSSLNSSTFKGKIHKCFNNPSNLRITGVNDDLGFDENINRYINFWGLEDWWGNGFEKLSNLIFTSSYYNYVITNTISITDGTSVSANIRQFIVSTAREALLIGKMVLGTNGDVIPISSGFLYDSDYAYYYNNSNNTSYNFYCNRAYNESSFASIGYTTFNVSTLCTRLCYKGNYTIINQ